ncbi:MAG TPA: ATP-binding protein, partial [Candidatus Methanoperedens sp.]|nr:ATP-binding protein [Candidatus Methanoperedens sp.]
PEWRALMSDYLANDVLGKHIRFDKEYRIVRNDDNAERWVHGLGDLEVDDQGQPVTMRGTIQDITERKVADQSRQLQSTALNAAANAIIITDRSGVLEWVNPAFTRLTGYAADEAIGRRPGELLKSGKHDQAFWRDFWDTILAKVVWHGETINRRKDGSLYTEEQRVTPVLSGSGAITHFVAIKEDITERMQLQAQLLQAQKMESVGRLAGGIAHDFNNLLTAIIATAELLAMRHGEDKHLHDRLQIILETGERASRIARQLLAFSRRQVLDPVRMDLNQMLLEIRKMLPSLVGEDIRCDFRLGEQIAAVKADPSQLEQVILNLVVNARDAMPRGGELTVTTTMEELDEHYVRRHPGVEPGRYVLLSVTDTGCGIPPEVQGKIFEPFFTTKGEKGTGLGLATLYGIVNQLGGHVTFYTEQGIGTEFMIYLKAQPADSAAGAVPQVQGRAPAPRGTERILVVEDEPTLREIAAAVLADLGYEVIAAAHAEEALSLSFAPDSRPQLLVSDVVLSGMRGDELSSILRDRWPGLRVILTSGYSQERLLHDGERGRATAFLHKPFSASALARRVREVLDSEPQLREVAARRDDSQIFCNSGDREAEQEDVLADQPAAARASGP